MKKLSKTKKMFSEIIIDMNRAHRFVSRTEWSILYDEEELMRGQNFRQRNERRRALSDLRAQKIIKMKKIGNQVFLELTRKGRYQAFIQLLRRKKKRLITGKICVVCFDVQECVRGVRDVLRKILFDCGFKKIQKSVWESVDDFAEEVSTFVGLIKADRWVRVYVADQ